MTTTKIAPEMTSRPEQREREPRCAERSSLSTITLRRCPTDSTHWIVTLVCRDQPGIVHADQRRDRRGGRQHHRVAAVLERRHRHVLHAPAGRVGGRRREAFEAALAPVTERYGMTWQLDVVGRPLRTLVLVSTAAHCLNDLLFRQRAGQLPVEIPLVLANHPDLAELAAFYGVPFEAHPVTGAEQKAAFEARVLAAVEEHDIELVVLARYMQILSPELCERARRPGHQHPPLVPARLQGREPVQAGARPRREDHRRDRALRHERPRRGPDHRAEHRARRPHPHPRRAGRDRAGRGVAAPSPRR